MRRERERSNRPEVLRQGHTAEVRLPSGVVKIIYGHHNQAQGISEIPQKTRGIALEIINSMASRVEDGYLDIFQNIVQYKEVVDHAIETGIPLYFHDIDRKGGPKSFMRKAVNRLRTPLEVGASLGALVSMNPEIILASTPLLYDTVGQVIDGIYATEIPTINESMKRSAILDRTHPYKGIISLKLRNMVWAHKLEWMLEQFEDQDAHLTTIVGAGHVGLERELQKNPEKRLRSLARSRRFWPYVSNDLSSFYSIVGYFPNPDTGEMDPYVMEVPDLKALVER